MAKHEAVPQPRQPVLDQQTGAFRVAGRNQDLSIEHEARHG
ncbi:hypothetical protein R2Q26_00520 [Nitrosomonas sp. Is37]|nr:hypothetical protein [Nitrosomonas sp. Is37]